MTSFSYPFSSSFLRRNRARSCPSIATTCSKAVSHSSVSLTSVSAPPPVDQLSGAWYDLLMRCASSGSWEGQEPPVSTAKVVTRAGWGATGGGYKREKGPRGSSGGRLGSRPWQEAEPPLDGGPV